MAAEAAVEKRADGTIWIYPENDPRGVSTAKRRAGT
jgi:hypothetical protein